MNVSRAAVKLYATNIATAVLNFAGIIIYSRILGPSTFGSLVLFQLLGTLVVVVTTFGYGGAIVKRLSEGREKNNIIATVVVIKFGTLIPLLAGILLFRHQINGYIGEPLALYLALFVVIEHLGRLVLAVIKGDLRVGETAIPIFVRYLSYFVVGAGLVLAGYGITGAVLGLLVGATLQLFVGLSRIDFTIGRPSLETGRSLTSFAKYTFVTTIGQKGFRWTDILFIGLLLSTTATGIYEIPWRIATVVMMLGSVLANVSFPQVSAWESEDQHEKIEGLLSGTILATLFLTVPALAGTVLLREQILRIVFGPGYADAAMAFVVIMLYVVVSSVTELLGETLEALDSPKSNAKADTIALVLNGILNVVLILSYGILGAAIASLAALCVRLLLKLGYIRPYVGVRFRWRPFLSVCAATGLMTVGLWGLRSVVRVSSAVELVGVVAVGISIYGCCIVVIPAGRSFVLRQLQSVGSTQ